MSITGFNATPTEIARVLHVIPSVSPKHGGPSFALPLITRASALQGLRTTIATTDDNGPGERLRVQLNELVPHQQGETGILYFKKNTEFYKVSLGLRRWLRAHVTDFDVVHIHALFSYSSYAAATAARRNGIPYVVRPLGVLNRWGIDNRRRAIKKLSLKLVELPILRNAAAVHFTSEAEQTEAIEAVPDLAKIRSAVIPLPIEMPATLASARRFNSHSGACVLFLSRIDKKKGIELLLEAFARVAQQGTNVRLLVAGAGEPGYVDSLKQKAKDLRISQCVEWRGFVEGKAKAAAFNEADVFVLPSYSENFGIAAAEALAAGVPSVISSRVAVGAAAGGAGAAVAIEPTVDRIAAALMLLLSGPQLRRKLSEKAVAFVRENYSFEAVGCQLAELYNRVERGTSPPQQNL